MIVAQMNVEERIGEVKAEFRAWAAQLRAAADRFARQTVFAELREGAAAIERRRRADAALLDRAVAALELLALAEGAVALPDRAYSVKGVAIAHVVGAVEHDASEAAARRALAGRLVATALALITA